MMPTFNDGDLVAFDTKLNPKRNDIVLIRNPDKKSKFKYITKRIVALGGEKVFYEKGRLLILSEGQVLDFGKSKPYQKKTVCKNFVFVVGDNRDFSFDSRQGALIPIRDIVGVFIYRAERSNKRKKKLNENRKRRVIPVVFHGSFLKLIKDVWDKPEIATGFLNSLNHKNFKKYK